jgi:hypothetical protein
MNRCPPPCGQVTRAVEVLVCLWLRERSPFIRVRKKVELKAIIRGVVQYESPMIGAEEGPKLVLSERVPVNCKDWVR